MHYRRKLKKIFAIFVIFSGLILISGSYVFVRHLRPRIIRISQSFAENEVSDIIDTEVQKLMLREFLNYDKITIINRDESGRVTSISANSAFINNFANNLDILVGRRIEESNTIKNDIYLSSLLGMEFFSGMGPKVPIRFQPLSVTHVDVSHTFEEAGINQTIHTIHLSITVEIEILVPFAYSHIDVVSDMPIAQTLIVGTVPEAYFKR